MVVATDIAREYVVFAENWGNEEEKSGDFSLADLLSVAEEMELFEEYSDAGVRVYDLDGTVMYTHETRDDVRLIERDEAHRLINSYKEFRVFMDHNSRPSIEKAMAIAEKDHPQLYGAAKAAWHMRYRTAPADDFVVEEGEVINDRLADLYDPYVIRDGFE